MKILSISAFTQNNYQAKSNTNLSINYLYFSGRKIEGDKFIKESLKRIANSEFGELPKPCQEAVNTISKQMDEAKEFFFKLRSNPYRAIAAKDNYPNFVRNAKKQGFSFKYGDDGSVITLLKNKNQDNLLRIFVETPDDKVQNILIEDSKKVVANLNEGNPFYIAQNLRYMTEEELFEAKIPLHIEFARSEMDKFSYYLKNYDTLFPPKAAKKTKAQIKAEEAMQQVKSEPVKDIVVNTVEDLKYSVKDLFSIFDKKPEELPAHINPLVSPSTNKILGFNIKMDDGVTLRVSKKVNPAYGSDLRYVSMEEIYPDGSKKYLNIDMQTQNFLRTGFDGKPELYKNNYLVDYYDSVEDLARYKINERFNKYMTAITSTNSESSKSERQITVLKQKTVKKAHKDIDISEFEDENLNKQLDAEYNNLTKSKPEFHLQSLKTFHLHKKKKTN